MTGAGALRTVRTPRGVVGVRRWGTGEPLVLLHPLALAGAVWAPLATELADRFQVLAPDLRGHGDSDWDGRPFTVEDLARDVAAALDELDVPTVSLVGLELGGSVGIMFAGLFPSRTLSLVLAGTAAWYGPTAEADWPGRAERAGSTSRVEQAPSQVDGWFSAEFADRRPDQVGRVARIFAETDSAAHAAAARALGALDARALLPAIQAPALVLAGAQDRITPPALAREVAAGIPAAAWLELPGLRQLSLVERPGLAEIIRRQVHGLPIPGALPGPSTPTTTEVR
jgi:3-oxoadipate enol-lactonase